MKMIGDQRTGSKPNINDIKKEERQLCQEDLMPS